MQPDPEQLSGLFLAAENQWQEVKRLRIAKEEADLARRLATLELNHIKRILLASGGRFWPRPWNDSSPAGPCPSEPPPPTSTIPPQRGGRPASSPAPPAPSAPDSKA